MLLFAFFWFFTFSAEVSIAQKVTKPIAAADDSVKFALKYQDSLLHKAKKSDTSINNLLDKIEYYTASYNQINSLLSKNIDTNAISSNLPRLERGIKIIKETVSNSDKSSTLRYLYAEQDILTHIEDRLNDWQEKLSEMNARLVKIQNRISEFKNDPSLSYIPAESTLRNQYIEQLSLLNTKFYKLEITSRKKFLSIGILQNRVVQNYIKITDYKNQITVILNRFTNRALSKEYPYIWKSKQTDYPNNLSLAWAETVKMNKKMLTYFVVGNYDIHLYGMLLLAAFFYWITYNLRKIRKTKEDYEVIFAQTSFVSKHPLLSALTVSGIITTFLYDHPPVVFVEGVMLMLVICTGILLRGFLPQNLLKYWILIIGLTVIYSVSNLFVKASFTDRITVFVLGIISLIGSYAFLKSLKKTDLVFPQRYCTILRVFMLMQIASLLLNTLGRFSIAKLISVTALFGLWQAVTLFVFMRIIMEVIFLQLEGSKLSSNSPSYFDYKTLQGRLQNIIRFVAIVFWLIWIADNLNIIDFLVDFFSELLNQTHTIGDTKFTIGNVVTFVIILWIASTLSKVITYFFEFADEHAVTTTRKNKLSSSILLVKLTIFGLGFLLAIIASSIPVEKINIIIGALSVGIGFGLQTIVNNLVSGVILAFEKPVQIGDIIEVGGHSGTIKEMGIRASKIATSDGSEIIVPNGDLLSQHLTNWTLSNNNRRVELIVGVAYGTELDKVRKLLYHLVMDREDIMKEPEPMVLIHTFSDKCVDFRILFWVPDLTKWLELKSRVMSDIYEMFYKEGIEIPFQQKEVHLYYSDEKELEKKLVKEASAKK